MIPPWTVRDVVNSLSNYPTEPPLSAPTYSSIEGPRAALVVPSMERHTSNEGWHLALALRAGGYELFGAGIISTNVPTIIDRRRPSVVFVQDQHEWDSGHLAKREEYFHNSVELARRPEIFKLTVVKDTHRQYESARRYSQAIGCHAWVVYYNKDVVLRTLNWLRPEHVIRTYHTIDPNEAPKYKADGRQPCILSGSLGGAYPLRERIHAARLPNVTFLKHPGYHNTGSYTPAYLDELSRYRVAICTASKFGYALRKHMEATACGCRVVTDLPSDEVLPGIDENLVRIHPNEDMREIGRLVERLCDEYDPSFQERMAREAIAHYDYHSEGVRLAAEIERVRASYESS